MIITKHKIELIVDGKSMDLPSSGLNLRMNNVIFDPTKLKSTQAEYSFTFSLPATKENMKTLSFGNIKAQTNKFRRRYNARVLADGYEVFDGSMIVKSYKNDEFECNLVSIKVQTVEDIFGESVLTDIPWFVDFSGATTINSVNNDPSTKYFFPLVSYGVFQKEPYLTDSVANEYTSKFEIDKYNRFWYESFYPSVNVMELVKRAFEWKGYQVNGNAFLDPKLNSIYASVNLDSDQIPLYNLGNPLFGKLQIDAAYSTTESDASVQELKFPYYRMEGYRYALEGAGDVHWNFDNIDVFRPMEHPTTFNIRNQTYMLDGDEHLIVIPADGWYLVHMDASGLLTTNTFRAFQWINTYEPDQEYEQRLITITADLEDTAPIEIQLVRNYDNDAELIKGAKNIRYHTGDPSQATYDVTGRSTTYTMTNKEEWLTAFPHQDICTSVLPTDANSLTNSALYNNYSEYQNDGKPSWEVQTGRTDATTAQTGSTGGVRGGGRNKNSATATTTDSTSGERAPGVIGGGRRVSRKPASAYQSTGYIPEDDQVFPYDPVVNSNFICGFSTLCGGSVSVIKNGYSWSKMTAAKNEVMADVAGLTLVESDHSGGTVSSRTDYNANTLPDSPQNFMNVYNSGKNFRGSVSMLVWLNRNDLIEPLIIQRDYGGVKYSATCAIWLEIQAMSQNTQATLRSQGYGYTSPTQFPTQLNLTNFMNNTTQVSTWIENVLKAFNLTMYNYGNLITIEKNKFSQRNVTHAVDLDNRVDASISTSKSSSINYPKEMSVRWKIDRDEWGFERTVPQEHINDSDWYNWGDSGFTTIKLNDDTYATSTNNESVDFSYTYYDQWLWKEVINGIETGTQNYINMPVIEHSEYMADGYGYEDAMKHDGYSLTQRFWFRGTPTDMYVNLADHQHEKVFLTVPEKTLNGFNLSYKDSEESLLTNYFNANPLLASNFEECEVYISPIEYQLLKDGAMCHYDDDLYYISEISGYDPTCNNTTKLKMIKKL